MTSPQTVCVSLCSTSIRRQSSRCVMTLATRPSSLPVTRGSGAARPPLRGDRSAVGATRYARQRPRWHLQRTIRRHEPEGLGQPAAPKLHARPPRLLARGAADARRGARRQHRQSHDCRMPSSGTGLRRVLSGESCRGAIRPDTGRRARTGRHPRQQCGARLHTDAEHAAHRRRPTTKVTARYACGDPHGARWRPQRHFGMCGVPRISPVRVCDGIDSPCGWRDVRVLWLVQLAGSGLAERSSRGGSRVPRTMRFGGRGRGRAPAAGAGSRPWASGRECQRGASRQEAVASPRYRWSTSPRAAFAGPCQVTSPR